MTLHHHPQKTQYHRYFNQTLMVDLLDQLQQEQHEVQEHEVQQQL